MSSPYIYKEAQILLIDSLREHSKIRRNKINNKLELHQKDEDTIISSFYDFYNIFLVRLRPYKDVDKKDFVANLVKNSFVIWQKLENQNTEDLNKLYVYEIVGTSSDELFYDKDNLFQIPEIPEKDIIKMLNENLKTIKVKYIEHQDSQTIRILSFVRLNNMLTINYE